MWRRFLLQVSYDTIEVTRIQEHSLSRCTGLCRNPGPASSNSINSLVCHEQQYCRASDYLRRHVCTRYRHGWIDKYCVCDTEPPACLHHQQFSPRTQRALGFKIKRSILTCCWPLRCSKSITRYADPKCVVLLVSSPRYWGNSLDKLGLGCASSDSAYQAKITYITKVFFSHQRLFCLLFSPEIPLERI
jgi:hypothetical protein